ncbi:hypothetical protein [Caulobacter sp. UNC279MFTsu5.1]|uniref:hypothetical protein n=1 Tax=Caulobacter sp. UNC279MFTsu5.1 TaxID=1502775 RepID=UPI00035EC4E9|nr:hypothetical protein [Caulobacter sp. UNC279MFTsu5.1]SFK54535.1 hypothetical protein SAMN02799626_04571 [Caulobacter sp. UNC279MFTsu5.1]
MGNRPTALVLYNWRGQWPMRRWEHQRIFAWKAYFPGPVTFLNIGFPFNPAWITRLDPELVMVDATALAARYTPVGLSGLRRAMDAVPARARRVAAPLDEFLGLQPLRDVLVEARIDLLLTALEPALWGGVYPVVQRPYALRRFLTAYVDDGLARRASSDLAGRSIAVSYRAWETPAWLGEMGRLKREVGLRAEAWAQARGHRADVAVDGQRRLVGDAWIRLLGASRAVVGVEGGSSLVDPAGELPTSDPASSGPEGWTPPASAVVLAREAEIRAMSPRHLEAVATRTFQVLVEGDYSGVLEAGVHYQPVRRDLSDIEAALDASRDPRRAQAMADRAHDEIVASGRYSWRTVVGEITDQVLA